MKVRQVSILSVIALILAIFSWPYGYYVILRWLISLSAGYLAYRFYKKQNSMRYVFVLILLLFNPIYPVYLTKQIWVVLDLVVSMVFLFGTKNASNE